MSMSAKCDRIVLGLEQIFHNIACTDSQSRYNIQTKACMRLLANTFKHKLGLKSVVVALHCDFDD